MTAIRQEAMQMLEKVPEDKLSFVIQIMQGVNGLLESTEEKEKDALNLKQFVMASTQRGQDADGFVRELRDHDRFYRVFIDTAPIIYFLENSSLYMESMERFFAKCVKEHKQIVISALTVEEYLVSPYSNGQMEYVDNFKRFIKYMDVEVVDIDATIAERGAKIRGQYKNFKAMDSLPDCSSGSEKM